MVSLTEGDSLREAGLGLGLGLGLGTEGRVRFAARGSIDGVRLSRLAHEGSRPDKLTVISLEGVVERDDLRMVLLGVDSDGVIVAGKLDDARAVELELEVEAYTF